MSKRFNYVQQGGERKKPRLDITVHDHNFPLSQNPGPSRAEPVNTWDDDIDEEMLLQASQACEQSCTDTSVLPAYTQFTRPASSSTQIPPHEIPSTSRGGFTFKTPAGAKTSSTRDKFNRIASPLSGISKNDFETIDPTDMYFTDRVINTGDTDNVYRQLLKLQEENAKLKSENGKLSEKFVTKEGEASILRTQLKSCQMAVDNARMERVKAQEQTNMEWSKKMIEVTKQLGDLKTQLDFKNLEILNMKDKCKMLESNKVRLTQVTLTGNEFGTSQRLNRVAGPQVQKVTSSAGVQTDNHSHFLKLNKPHRKETSRLALMMPLIMEPTADQKYPFLEYNENLKRPADQTPNECAIFSTFHRLGASSTSKPKSKINISCIYEDLSCIAASDNVEKLQDKYVHVFNTTRSVLEDVCSQLASAARRCTSAFQKEMDERYLDSTGDLLPVTGDDLLAGRELYKEEQGILARRMMAVVVTVLDNVKVIQLYNKTSRCMDVIRTICTLLDDTSCAVLYSGLLLSIIMVIDKLIAHSQVEMTKVLDIVKRIISSRALLFVPCYLLKILCKMKQEELQTLCVGSSTGNLKVDHDQGVLLYKKDSCPLQVLLRQVEAATRCAERRRLRARAAAAARDLVALDNVYDSALADTQTRCDCSRVLIQCIVYSLKVCSAMLVSEGNISEEKSRAKLARACRSGLQCVHARALRDVQLAPRLRHAEGHLLHFCENLRHLHHTEFYDTMLLEILGPFQAAVEERPAATPRSAWLKSFENFCKND